MTPTVESLSALTRAYQLEDADLQRLKDHAANLAARREAFQDPRHRPCVGPLPSQACALRDATVEAADLYVQAAQEALALLAAEIHARTRSLSRLKEPLLQAAWAFLGLNKGVHAGQHCDAGAETFVAERLTVTCNRFGLELLLTGPRLKKNGQPGRLYSQCWFSLPCPQCP